MFKIEFPEKQLIIVSILAAVTVIALSVRLLNKNVTKVPIFEEKKLLGNCWFYQSDVVRSPIIGCD